MIFKYRDLVIAAIPAILISILWYLVRGDVLSCSAMGIIAFLGFWILAKLSRMDELGIEEGDER